MFKLDASSDYWYPVNVAMLDAEGRTKKVSFDAKFRRLSKDELKDVFNPDNTPRNDNEICDDVFLGWRKVQDAEGNELANTLENRELFLAVHPVQPSIVRAWLESIGIRGKEKN